MCVRARALNPAKAASLGEDEVGGLAGGRRRDVAVPAAAFHAVAEQDVSDRATHFVSDGSAQALALDLWQLGVDALSLTETCRGSGRDSRRLGMCSRSVRVVVVLADHDRLVKGQELERRGDDGGRAVAGD